MAAPETSASSRLQLLQARFQQKQLQEKEQKLLQLYDQQQQRAHQVAQRGSAGSSGSNGSSGGIAKPMGKVRQMFNERRQSTLKGIDKSYPLEPLGRRTNNTNGPPSIKKNISQVPNTRRNVGAKRTVATRADVNSNLSRESYASSRNPHNSTTRDSYGELRETGSIRQLNGYARNDQQHYEINIDDVIDNAAMERNRMLAKFDPAEIDKRRNLVGDLDEFSDDVPSKHNREKKTPPIPKKRTEVIPSPRKTEIARGNAESKKNLTPYPSSKSPETTQEQKHRPEKENGYSSAAQKSYVSSSDTPDSAVTDSTNRSYDNEKPVVPATRTSSSLSSSSSIGTNRSQPLSNDRQTRQSVTKTKSTGVTPTSKSTFSPRNSISKQDDSLVSCKICKRRFMTDRIKFHEEICAKTTQKKRKQFDVVTHRVKGTELESFVQKKPSTKKQTKAPKPEAPKSNWRRKHEDFISAIRSAKQMQAHLAAGGKLSDLPPPPASDTSDYIQCPHCSRKFNQGAAERHIPKCETMLHNKPRAPVATRAKR